VVIDGGHGGFDDDDRLNGLITTFLSAHDADRAA
jgi:hypothetical protein